MLRTVLSAFAALVAGFGALAVSARPAAGQCTTPIFATPVLGCPSIVTYLSQNHRASASTVATADFDNDGKLDVVVAESGATDIELSVGLGNGDGTFRMSDINPGFPAATWAVPGDFNGDGKLDIAAGTQGGALTILLGDGNGGFTLKQALSVTGCCAGPLAGAAGDFNGDGKLDLVVVDDGSSNAATIYLGNGDGTFTAKGSVVVGTPGTNNPGGVIVGDFNKDGKLDFATANDNAYYSSSMSIVLGNGDGTFQAVVNYPTGNADLKEGTHGGSLVAADFNHDGYLDVAVIHRGSSIAIFVNHTDGTFGSPAYFGGSGTATNPFSSMAVAVGDFNHDGNPDLVYPANQRSAAGVLLGNGDGTFGRAAWYATDVDATGVAVADINGDGNLDFIVSAEGNNTLTVVLGKGDGTFKSARNYLPAIITSGFTTNGPNPSTAAFGDFNGDGKPDMAVVDSANSDVAIFTNNGDGAFTESGNFSTGPNTGTMVVVGDLNRDGKLDLVIGLSPGTASYNFSVLLGNGNGTFQSPVLFSNGANTAVDALALADVNNDGFLDVVSNQRNDKSLYVNLGKGDGTFQSAMATPAICPAGTGGTNPYLLVADLNNDGKPDITAACNGSLHQTVIYVLLGNGDGTFGNPSPFASGTTPVSYLSGDFNQDGKQDLAVLDNWPNPAVSILLGNGDGSFQNPVAYSVFSSSFWTSWIATYGNPNTPFPNALAVADFNLDGHLDLLVGDADTYNDGQPVNGYSYNNGVQLFLGNGDGTFQAEQSYLAGRAGDFLAVADLDGNGSPDVVVVSPQDTSVNILLNLMSKPTVVLQSITVAPATASVPAGLTQQFTATGHYSDGATQDLTASATWSSSNTSIATVNSSGLAAGVAAGGPVTIKASMSSINGTASLTVTAPALQSISVSPASATIAAGLTQQFAATGHYSDNSTQDVTTSVTWTSSNTSVATVSNTAGSQGVSKGIAVGGPVSITATQGAISNSGQLTVTAPVLNSITVTPVNPSVQAGSTQQFTATGNYSDGSTQNLTSSVTWSSSNTAVATINASGLASAMAAGTSTISAKLGSVTGSTTMTVAALQTMTISPVNPSIFTGSTLQFTATGHYSDGSTRDLTTRVNWASMKTNVATITSGGLATAKAKGTTTITASSGAISGSTALTVSDILLQSIVVTPSTATISVGGTQQFKATGNYNNGSTQDITASVTWTTSPKQIASITNTGLATGLKPEKATVTAKSGSVSASAALSVQ